MDGAFHIWPWLVEPGLNTVSRNGTSVRLEPKQMEVLVCLARHAGESVSKEQLLQTVWPDTFVGDDVLTRSIFALRRVFEDDAKDPKVIQTIAKRGYRLILPVTPANGIAYEAPGHAEAEVRDGTKRDRSTLRLGILVGVGLAVLLGAILGFMPNLWRRRAAAGSPEIRSLAVLPLQNLSGDPAQEYFSDGMTEELITEL